MMVGAAEQRLSSWTSMTEVIRIVSIVSWISWRRFNGFIRADSVPVEINMYVDPRDYLIGSNKC